jgi:uncharacterized protein with HEPN domain
MKKSDKIILEKMLSYCKEIETPVSSISYDDFMMPQMYEKRNSCSFALLQIGELTKKLSADFKLQYDDVKWKNWSGVRNTIAHNYEGFDMKRAWNLCVKHSLDLSKSIDEIIAKTGKDC